VDRHLHGGATIRLHDADLMSWPGSWKATLAALPALIVRIQIRGWQVGPLSDHHRTPTPVTLCAPTHAMDRQHLTRQPDGRPGDPCQTATHPRAVPLAHAIHGIE
jgi:hypothetical protein